MSPSVTPSARTLHPMSGLRSLLVGAHCFFLHPIAVYRAWVALYGPARDARLLLAFLLHDVGYALTSDLDGPQGERHVELGARLMTRLCDPRASRQPRTTPWGTLTLGPWGEFTLLHSRYYARHLGLQPSRLCAADKLAITFEPAYELRVILSGEVQEYLRHAQAGRYPDVQLPEGAGVRLWATLTKAAMRHWAWTHAAVLTPEPGGPS
ncbi:hypothetical protein DGo_PB0033 (plasmid) [Deinococcus gobiensis I-0]|uniref:HD domain-containing protein n=2 Tax=Deinococcus TaxID=1298 RepID=H8H1A5_DEIGI|nr:hypothetical protein DGo_PB0033 [Deinococcus gobiensis I-0]